MNDKLCMSNSIHIRQRHTSLIHTYPLILGAILTLLLIITTTTTMLDKKNKIDANPGTSSMRSNGGSLTSHSSTFTSVSGSRKPNDRRRRKAIVPSSIETFEGDSIALQVKVFTVGADQVV